MKRQLHFESLSPRLVLSAQSLVASDSARASGEPDDHIIQQTGDLLFVIGRAVDNDFAITLGETEHQLTLDGETYTYDATTINQILIAGSRGNDRLDVNGTQTDETLHVRGDEVTLAGSGLRLLAKSVEAITIHGGGGNDTANFQDTPGDDQLRMTHVDATLSTSTGVEITAVGYDRVEAFATAGGTDSVTFIDSPADDRFQAKDGFSFLVGENFWNYAKGFERVEARYETGGNDEALFYDSPGNDTLTASPGEVRFDLRPIANTSNATHVAIGFPVTRAFASDGIDEAMMSGQAEVADRFNASPTSAFLRTPDVSVNFAAGFDRVEATGQDDADRAELTGSDGDDEFVALPESAELSGSQYAIQANDFGLVRAFGQSGNDRVTLQDSSGNDRFEARDDFAFLRGLGFTNYAEGFEVIDAIATEGYDVAVMDQLGDPDLDFVITNGPAAMIWGPVRNERLIRFDHTETRGNVGLNGIAPLEGTLRIDGNADTSVFPSQEDADEILARFAEPTNPYVIINGEIVRSELS